MSELKTLTISITEKRRLFKFCPLCKDHYELQEEIELLDLNNLFCPIHKEKLKKRLFHNIIRTRLINANLFDVRYRDEKGLHHGCRACGNPIPKKMREYCSDECRSKFYNFLNNYNFFYAKETALYNNYHEHEAFICYNILQFKLNNYNVCERCGKFSSCEVHHIIPVHTLNFQNLNLIGDLKNLQVLCKECHNLTKSSNYVYNPEDFTWYVKEPEPIQDPMEKLLQKNFKIDEWIGVDEK